MPRTHVPFPEHVWLKFLGHSSPGVDDGDGVTVTVMVALRVRDSEGVTVWLESEPLPLLASSPSLSSSVERSDHVLGVPKPLLAAPASAAHAINKVTVSAPAAEG